MTQPTSQTLIERINRRVAGGELWKAKELAKTYAGILYDPQLWILCGTILLGCEDRWSAGRLLFFAGSTDKQHREAIDLYISRCGEGQLRSDIRKIDTREALPAGVVAELKARGLDAMEEQNHRNPPGNRTSGLFDGALILVFLTILALGIWKAIVLLGALFWS